MLTDKIFHQSEIQAYIMCPKRYKYEYIDGVKAAYRSPKLIFGTAAHNIIRHLHRREHDAMVGLDFIRGAIDTAEYEPNPDYPDEHETPVFWQDRDSEINAWVEDFSQILNNYWATNKNAKVIFAEAKFRVKIGKFPFEGRIDQVRENDRGEWILIDYKSGDTQIDLVEMDLDYQHSIYGYALGNGELRINGEWVSVGRYPDFVGTYRLKDHLPYKRKTKNKNGEFQKGDQRGLGLYLTVRQEADYDNLIREISRICGQITGPHYDYISGKLKSGGTFPRQPNMYMHNCAMCGFRRECVEGRRQYFETETINIEAEDLVNG